MFGNERKRMEDKRHNELLDISFPFETLFLDITLSPCVNLPLLSPRRCLLAFHNSLRRPLSSPLFVLFLFFLYHTAAINILKFNFHKSFPEITVK